MPGTGNGDRFRRRARRGAFPDPIDFDALGWGVPPSSIPATDTAQLLALVVAQQVLRDAAGSQFETMDRSRTTEYRRRRRTEKQVVNYSCEPLDDSRRFGRASQETQGRQPWSPGRTSRIGSQLDGVRQDPDRIAANQHPAVAHRVAVVVPRPATVGSDRRGGGHARSLCGEVRDVRRTAAQPFAHRRRRS
jgi:hypothetical protein